MTKDDFQSLELERVMELDARVTEFGERMAKEIDELKAAVSRVEIEVEAVQAEIAKMNLMIARRQRVLGDCSADGSSLQPTSRPPATPDTTG